MRSLIHFKPGSELRRMQNEFDRLFDGFFPNVVASNGTSTEHTVWSPRVDLLETEAGYVVELDVPGIPKKDISISYHDDVLTISGERKAEEKTDDENYVRIERSFGQFKRTFRLPQAIKVAEISAKYKDGVLRIDVPKAEEVKPVSIKVS